MNFNNSVFKNKISSSLPFLVAHRGVNGANIPCNTLLAYKIAVYLGADVVEIDVSKSKDGKYFAFHPGTEKVFLKCGKTIPEMTAKEVKKLRLLNSDETPTHYGVPTLEEVFKLLKDKVYINVDKFWTDIEGITRVIRDCGVEKQVIVKTPAEESYFSEVEKFAPDFAFMPLARRKDAVTQTLKGRNINYIGTEAIFESLSDEVATREYIEKMHRAGLLVWANAIVYDEREVISAGLTDDISLKNGGDCGWGKIADLGFDFIQTDWLSTLKNYLRNRQL